MNIFLSGIGGVGLGPLAEIAFDAGYAVTGSDQNHSLTTDELEKRGVKIYFSQDEKTIAAAHKKNPIDWLIYTSALPDDAPELIFAKKNSIRATKRDAFLANLIEEKNLKLLAIAGTHGKTTTTAMLVWAFKQLGAPISYSIGSNINFGASGAFDPASQFFAYEADEYDRNFLHFSPFIAAIPSLDYDHADIYPTQENYLDAFREFVAQSETLLTFSSVKNLLGNISEETHREIFAEKNYAEFALAGRAIRQDAKLILEIMRQIWPEIREHSTQNLPENFDEKMVIEILNNFPGTSRRFEQLAPNIYSDYAHHPVEIKATLERARELSDHVVVVYQGHQNLRQIEIAKNGGYGDTFSGAEEIFIAPTYLARGDLADGAPPIISPAEMIATFDKNSRAHAKNCELNDELWQKILNLSKTNLILLIGAGTIDTWARQNLQQ